MLHPFVNAAASGRIHPSIAAGSAALHAAILFLVVAPTQPVRYTERPRASLERVQLNALVFASVPAPAARTLVARQVGPVELRSVRTHAVVSDFHDDLPVVATPATDENEHDGGNALNSIALHTVPKPANELVFPSVAFEMQDVDIQAEPLPTNPKPRYPPSMQRRQVQARFGVYFVIDTSGHIDLSSIELPTVSHEDFLHEVLVVLPKWTFEPAVVGGRRVRERVLQPFNFQLK
jgi:TonB family protein